MSTAKTRNRTIAQFTHLLQQKAAETALKTGPQDERLHSLLQATLQNMDEKGDDFFTDQMLGLASTTIRLAKEETKSHSLNLRATASQHRQLEALVIKYPLLTRHALAKAALDLGLREIATDRNWLERAGYESGNLGQSFIERSKVTDNRTYFTHDNGSRPYAVTIAPNAIAVHTYPKGDHLGADYVVPVRYFERYQGYWPGYDPTCLAHGNSLLVRTGERQYVFIGGRIVSFETDDEITEYVSPLGNSDVPYPVAYGRENVYLLLEQRYVPRVHLKTPPTTQNAVAIYAEFYDHTPHTGKGSWDKSEPVRNLKVLAKRRTDQE